jgi:hypothetical protein
MQLVETFPTYPTLYLVKNYKLACTCASQPETVLPAASTLNGIFITEASATQIAFDTLS